MIDYPQTTFIDEALYHKEFDNLMNYLKSRHLSYIEYRILMMSVIQYYQFEQNTRALKDGIKKGII